MDHFNPVEKKKKKYFTGCQHTPDNAWSQAPHFESTWKESRKNFTRMKWWLLHRFTAKVLIPWNRWWRYNLKSVKSFPFKEVTSVGKFCRAFGVSLLRFVERWNPAREQKCIFKCQRLYQTSLGLLLESHFSSGFVRKKAQMSSSSSTWFCPGKMIGCFLLTLTATVNS